MKEHGLGGRCIQLSFRPKLAFIKVGEYFALMTWLNKTLKGQVWEHNARYLDFYLKHKLIILTSFKIHCILVIITQLVEILQYVRTSV
jgi:hypothetical protein